MKEEELVLTQIKGILFDMSEADREIVKNKIAQIKEITSDDNGIIALAYCAAEMTATK